MRRSIALAVMLWLGVACAAPGVERAPDESLHPASYTASGLPPLQGVWSIEEYTAAVALLERVAAEQPLRLPRLGSPRSGPVFARLVSPTNLDGLRAGEVSLVARGELLGRYGAAIQRVMKAYAAAEDRTGHVFLDEQLAFQSFILRTLLAGDALIAEMLAALPPGSADHAQLSRARDDARATLGKCITSLMGLLRVTRYSFSDERLRAMRELQPLAAPVYRIVPTEAQDELKRQLAEMKENEADPMWRVCASTLDALADFDDPGREARPRVVGPRDADRKIIRGGW